MSADLLLAWYGDDFTGSTDCMEFLARAGLRAVLFLEPPGEDALRRFEGLHAVGVAGGTRGLPTAELERVLAPVFEAFRSLRPSYVHYKVCSTFDSSPQVGSIGRVIDVAARFFPATPVPLLVGAPALGRYCVFGNLFARSGLDTEPYRLDRHPTMRHHPITPMDESDLRVHLARQTDRAIALLDVLALDTPGGGALRRYRELAGGGAEIVLIDVLEERHLPVIGQVLETLGGGDAPALVVGSSAVETALASRWRERGIAHEEARFPTPGVAEPLLVVSGSCSPVTERQIDHVVSRGFVDVAIDTVALVGDEASAGSAARVAAESIAAHLESGRSVVAHSGRGPNDPRLARTRQLFARRSSLDDVDVGVQCGGAVGRGLGELTRRVLERFAPRRVVIAGGDTSGRVAAALGIEALEMIAPMAPGSPLVRAHALGTAADGLEFMFKGGQVGATDLLERTAFGAV